METFCLLLWQKNGGRVTPDGEPVLERDRPVRGYCPDKKRHPRSAPWDCYECPILQESIAHMATLGYRSAWICPDCAGDATKEVRALGLKAALPGYYGEGYCQREQCQRPLHARHGEGEAARHSILLQLFMWRPNQE